MNTTVLARSPPAGFFICPKLSNKQGEEPMNDIFEKPETMQENEHPRFYTAEFMTMENRSSARHPAVRNNTDSASRRCSPAPLWRCLRLP